MAMNLVRPRRGRGRVIAGVCAAIANRYQWNPTTVRVLTLLSFILPGTQLIIYVVLWILIPQEV
ncbi:PspC domain-containing protein [Labedella phragmitis]|uniref:PspC domain-containing protein n=2 Tax=Labedella phragmitis TaxID=2498849 RepID=A0A3S4DM61_9MICO|nr:PspC domain-containing protein [Labedella phragmitis]